MHALATLLVLTLCTVIIPCTTARAFTAAKLTGASGNEATNLANIALDGERFNRQLHPKEIDRIKEMAKAWAARTAGTENPINETEALARLTSQALHQVDRDFAAANPGIKVCIDVLLPSLLFSLITTPFLNWRYEYEQNNRVYGSLLARGSGLGAWG